MPLMCREETSRYWWTEGDNVTKKSPNMPWYTGKALLEHLETVDVSEAENVSEFYLPVQRVSRPNHEFRGFQGQIESGRVMLAAYKRKTGKEEAELLSMMSAETFMTGKEAKEQGFVDELIETSDEVKIAASADKTALYVSGRFMPLYGATCPENIPVVNNAPNITAAHRMALQPESNEGNANKSNNNEGGKTTMAV